MIEIAREDVHRVLSALESYIRAIQEEREARRARDAVLDRALSNGGRSQNTLNFHGAPAAWVAATCAAVAALAVLFFSVIFAVLFGVAFLFFAARDDWAAAEFNTLRTFIHTGRLQPMQPRPGVVDSLAPAPTQPPERMP